MTPLLKRNKQDEQNEAPLKEKGTKKVASKKKIDKKKDVAITGQTGRVLSSIVLKRPFVTEKSHQLSQSGVYVFEVALDCDKSMIRRAVEELYSVSVVSVRTIRQKGIERRFGRSLGRTKNVKKAMVTLKKGQTIEIFQGA